MLQISGDLKGIPDADQHVAYLDQYVLEFQPDEKTRETKFSILDDGRIEIVPNSTNPSIEDLIQAHSFTPTRLTKG